MLKLPAVLLRTSAVWSALMRSIGSFTTVHPFKHANTLTDFSFGRLSGFICSFNPSSPVRVWFLLVDASLELHADTQKNSIKLDFRKHS